MVRAPRTKGCTPPMTLPVVSVPLPQVLRTNGHVDNMGCAYVPGLLSAPLDS